MVLARGRAYAVHAYTACGVVLALLAAREIAGPSPDPRLVFLWLLLAVFVDATDGWLARAWRVAEVLPEISGRTIDDIVDYLTFTFLPLLLVWRMGWLPAGGLILVALAMMASLFGFGHVDAKDEATGFFRGFPSYWNMYAFYAGLLSVRWGGLPPAGLLVGLVLLTFAPVRFIYPTRVARPWQIWVLAGAAFCVATLVAILPRYPVVPNWLLGLSLVYPFFYVVLSWYRARRA